MKKRSLLFLFLAVVVLGIISILGWQLLFQEKVNPYCTFESRLEEIEKYTIADAKTVGWIQVQGTNINYPVIEETQEAYASGLDYLWRVNSYKEGENRTAIYGHNILNVSNHPLINDKEHTRFEPLMGFVYEDFAQKNLYIQYTHDGEDAIYKIYAVTFLYSTEDFGSSYSYDDKDTLDYYIKRAKELSIYDYDVDVNPTDELISLITCTRYFGTMGKTQFRVDARKIRKNENIQKYSVETNENYAIIKDSREVEQ